MKKTFLFIVLSIFLFSCNINEKVDGERQTSVQVETEIQKDIETVEKDSNAQLNTKIAAGRSAQTIQPYFYDELLSENGDAEVVTFSNPADMKAALLSGDIDLSVTNWVAAIMARANGEPIKVVASTCQKCSALVVGTDSGIESIQDLKGKNIGYLSGTMHNILLLEVLDRAGLDPNTDVNLVNIGFFEMGQALSSESIDAYLSGEPFPSIAVEDGYGKILEYPYFDDSIGYINAVMITREDLVKGDPEKVQNLVELHKEATEYALVNKDIWIQKAVDFGIEKHYIEKSLDNIELTWDITQNNMEQVKNLAEKMKELGMIDEVPNIDEMVDFTFIDKLR